LIELALNTPGIHIYSDAPLVSPTALETADVRFVYSAHTPAVTAQRGIFSAGYVPGSLIPIVDAAESFPESLVPLGVASSSARERFTRWITNRATITAEESLKQHEGIDKVWQKFQSTFVVLQGIIYYEPIYRRLVTDP
jgi:adenosine deaminase CECR1